MELMVSAGVTERLRQAIRLAGITQAEFAERMGTTQGAVSQWLSGAKQLSTRNMVTAAEVLKLELDWLLRGVGRGPQPDYTKAREEYKKQVAWIFRPVPPDLGRDYGNANVWSLPWNIDTFVRESGQNSGDEALDASEGIDMEYRLIRLRGEDLSAFLHALKWGDSDASPGLLDHVKASSLNTQKLSRILQDGLDQLTKDGEMLLLRVDDYGTRGLIGEEFGKGNFAALTRNNLDNTKSGSGTAGGSYGLGKAVFTRASRFATVLYNSTLSTPEEDVSGEEQREGRVFGRSDLTWHEIKDKGEYAGPGWLGIPDKSKYGTPATSSWNNPALIYDLYLDRDRADPGTSILVVNFHDPGSEVARDMEDLAAEIAGSVARNFWPALVSGRLRVRVTTYEGREPRSVIPVDAERYQAPFVDALKKYGQQELAEELKKPGDVVLRRVTLHIPRRKASIDPHPGLMHEAVLLVRRAEDDAADDLLRNVALFRGREMVIKYLPLGNLISGAVPFHAVVLCGEAVGDGDDDDRAAERFLRTAEPPAHNTWELTPDLKVEYARGSGQALSGFFGEIRERVRELVRPNYGDLDEGPQSLRELLRISGEQINAPTPATPRVLVDRSNTYVDEQGRWVVQGIIKLPDERDWRVMPALLFAAESGGSRRVGWSLEPVSGCTVFGNELDIAGGVREARFKGISHPETHPVPALESAVSVVIKQARPVGGKAV